MIRPTLLALAALLTLAATAQAGERPEVAAGRRVAQRSCAGCHAIDQAQSPLPEAPPFALLHMRYPKGGGLDALLAGGMLPPDRPQEEGRGLGHWRMSTIALDPDEIASLKAYIRSLEPGGG
jgi:mono/diheme cytochrome c family protein